MSNELVDIDNDEALATEFARLIADGESRLGAWCIIFKQDKPKKSDIKAYNSINQKVFKYTNKPVVSKKLDDLQTQIHLLFSTEHYNALRSQYNLAMTANSEKVRGDVLHQFIQNTRKPDKYSTDEVDEATLKSAKLLEDIAEVFKNASSTRSSDVTDQPKQLQ